MPEERVQVAVTQAAKRREIVRRADARAEAALVRADGVRLEPVDGVHVALPRRRTRTRRRLPVARVAELEETHGRVVQRAHQFGPLLRRAIVERAFSDGLA